MPQNTPRQKIQRVRSLGGEWTRLQIVGDTFDAAKQAAESYARDHGMTFIHPFDDPDVIAGQGTVALEMADQLSTPPDLLLVPVGGGGLLAGTLLVTRELWPDTVVIGVEPEGAASMRESVRAGRVVPLERVNPFVDGAAVREAGALPYAIRAANPGRDLAVNEGLVCSAMIELYQNEGIVAEPAGALTVAALRQIRGELEGKTVACVISGGNNDISRYSEIIERSLLFEGLKHYFLVDFPQRAGALRRYIDEALGPNDDITLFEYVKKNNREFGPALVGIELSDPADLAPLLARMEAIELKYEKVDADSVLYRFLL
jgi:threonine dehydratase